MVFIVEIYITKKSYKTVLANVRVQFCN